MSVHHDTIAAIILRHADREGPLLPILHDIQQELGIIDEAARRQVASGLNLSRAEVHGVVSFYHDFRSERAVLPVIKLCRAEACQARGSENLARHLEHSATGKAQVEPVYCLGLCSVGPNAMVGDRLFARLSAANIDAVVAEAQA